MVTLRNQIYRKKRRTPRVQTDLRVCYEDASLDRVDRATCISEHGLYIPTNDIFQVGTRIQLSVEFPDRVVHHGGEVIWAIQVPDRLRDSLVYGMGIRFVEPEAGWFDFFRRWRRDRESTVEAETEAEPVAELQSR